jgi:molecular chaperone GrpE
MLRRTSKLSSVNDEALESQSMDELNEEAVNQATREAEAQAMIDAADELEDSLDDFDDTPDPIQQLHLEIARISRERDEAKNEALRSLADMQNFRKMSEVRLQQDRKFATEKLVRDLLPVLDNFDRALAHFNSPAADVTTLLDGIRAIQKQLHQALEGQGVKRILALGEAFDPEHHEALMTEESEHPSGTVLQELETGYQLHERVIRPARVKVSA